MGKQWSLAQNNKETTCSKKHLQTQASEITQLDSQGPEVLGEPPECCLVGN